VFSKKKGGEVEISRDVGQDTRKRSPVNKDAGLVRLEQLSEILVPKQMAKISQKLCLNETGVLNSDES
jgi:hypothetical protein